MITPTRQATPVEPEAPHVPLTPDPAVEEIPFHWSQIESTDYREYVANLRAIGCPEQMIRDIVAADLISLYRSRVEAIWQPTHHAYWEKGRQTPADADQRQQLMELNSEKSAVFEQLFGSPLNQQEILDTVVLQLHGSERELLFLSPAVREVALHALEESGLQQQLEIESRGGSRDYQKPFDEKMEILADVLTPHELDEFRLRYSPTAQQLRNELAYFDYTPDEFRTILDSRKENSDSSLGNLADRTAATEQIRELFGDERADEFERVTDILYMNARQPLENAGLPVESADTAYQIASETIRQAQQLVQDASLSVETRQYEVQALKDRALTEVAAIMGEKPSKQLQKSLRVFMHAAESSIEQP